MNSPQNVTPLFESGPSYPPNKDLKKYGWYEDDNKDHKKVADAFTSLFRICLSDSDDHTKPAVVTDSAIQNSDNFLSDFDSRHLEIHQKPSGEKYENFGVFDFRSGENKYSEHFEAGFQHFVQNNPTLKKFFDPAEKLTHEEMEGVLRFFEFIFHFADKIEGAEKIRHFTATVHQEVFKTLLVENPERLDNHILRHHGIEAELPHKKKKFHAITKTHPEIKNHSEHIATRIEAHHKKIPQFLQKKLFEFVSSGDWDSIHKIEAIQTKLEKIPEFLKEGLIKAVEKSKWIKIYEIENLQSAWESCPDNIKMDQKVLMQIKTFCHEERYTQAKNYLKRVSAEVQKMPSFLIKALKIAYAEKNEDLIAISQELNEKYRKLEDRITNEENERLRLLIEQKSFSSALSLLLGIEQRIEHRSTRKSAARILSFSNPSQNTAVTNG